ncbi:DUF4442 domain-containing protein [Flavobacteriaceae bacterium AU392]|nr:DUF4442 domain-containing protein [Flavobacteriaceae bacterium]RKM83641.1 DUF4442 domain-containing protein [Flavobacteriaceae bacterium AU392]
MKVTPRKINVFLMLKLPSAYICGVRVKKINSKGCITSVRLKWINKNPFKSLFWAVQGMAAELSTGTLVMLKIKESGRNISMLVANNNASFLKKAVGRITFECKDIDIINAAITKAIQTKEGQTFWVNAKGINKEGIQVCDFNFEWTIKLKT